MKISIKSSLRSTPEVEMRHKIMQLERKPARNICFYLNILHGESVLILWMRATLRKPLQIEQFGRMVIQ